MSLTPDEVARRTGLAVVGTFAFGDSPALADELLGFVRRGSKRATAASVFEAEAASDPIPVPGQLWGVLDGAGDLAFVTETVELRRCRLGEVTPAFAWDEGEFDRTLESWRDGHDAYYRRQGLEPVDDLEVLAERFRVVWPERDATTWFAPGVRELAWHEREWFREQYLARWGTTRMVSRGRVHDVATLPGLVLEEDGRRIGVSTFRPYPGGTVECVTFDAFEAGRGVVPRLSAAFVELGRRHGWRRLWLVTTNDNTPALRIYQRAGWELVALHHRSVDVARQSLKPEIPVLGLDGIPLRSELELALLVDGAAGPGLAATRLGNQSASRILRADEAGHPLE